MALLLLTALLVGKSAYGHPGGGTQFGEEWAEDAIENGCSCHMDEQLNEGTYMLEGIPAEYTPEVVYNISLSIDDKNVVSEEGALRYGGFLATVNEGAFVVNESFWVLLVNIFPTMMKVMTYATGHFNGLLPVKVLEMLCLQFISTQLME